MASSQPILCARSSKFLSDRFPSGKPVQLDILSVLEYSLSLEDVMSAAKTPVPKTEASHAKVKVSRQRQVELLLFEVLALLELVIGDDAGEDIAEQMELVHGAYKLLAHNRDSDGVLHGRT